MAAEVVEEPKATETPAVEETKKVVEEEDTKEKNSAENSTKKEAKKESAKKAPPKEPAPPKPNVKKQDFEKDLVYVYQFTRTPLLPSLSPFCLKVETWLRACQIDYENVDHKMKYRSQKGMLPFVELNGEEINDSAHIIRELTKRLSKDLDKSLSPEQHVVAYTTMSMIENHLYWVLYWWRSKYPGRFLKGSQLNVQTALGSKVPKPIMEFLFKLRFRQGQKRVRSHGLGMHTPEEIEELGREDLQSLSDLLGEKEFFFTGTEPTVLDVTAFSVLAQFVYHDNTDAPFPLHVWMLENCKNLQNFTERMKDRFFPDWAEMCENLDLNSHRPKPPPPEEKKEEPKKEEVTVEVKETEKKEDAPAPTEEKKEEPANEEKE